MSLAKLQTPATSPGLDSRDAVYALLAEWRDLGWLRELDLAFTQTVDELAREQSDQPGPLVILLCALVSHQVGRGHVCLNLDHLQREPAVTLALPPASAPLQRAELAPQAPAALLRSLTREELLDELSRSALVGDGTTSTPLVLKGPRLYLLRFWGLERRIANGIRQRLESPTTLVDVTSEETQTLGTALDVLFGRGEAPDYQKIACALAARRRFGIITGGPGTGKTTTVVRLLAALQSVASASSRLQKHRIRLAAPTGKAAARLNESISGAVNSLALEQLPGDLSVADIPSQVTTLHRLLGARMSGRQFRYHHDNRLPVDILVIDESSMVDVEMMASVMDALPDDAQLILIGDKDQLASVDAGAILGELCHRASQGHYSDNTAAWVSCVTGYALPEELLDRGGSALDQSVAMLRKSYRFGQDSGIGTLARAVNTDSLDARLESRFRSGEFADVALIETETGKTDPLAMLSRMAISGLPDAFPGKGEGRVERGNLIAPPRGYRHYLELLQNTRPEDHAPQREWDGFARRVLDAFNDFQILCALRHGPWGVETINPLVASTLQRAGLIAQTSGWYHGRPVLITANDYNLGLMNGDIGIAMAIPWTVSAGARSGTASEDKATALRVAFPAGDGSNAVRWISPSRLQQHETVYAMTVHKAQGSEFTHTCLVLPNHSSPVLSRELIYTGITRARHWFSLLAGDQEVFREAIGTRVTRVSGLRA